MGSYKTAGIILRRHNLGEADRILTIMTAEHGKVRAVAKGVRRIKSRLAGHLELFCHTQLMFAEGRNLDIVTSARLIDSSDGLTGHYDRLRLAYIASELVDTLVDEGESQPAVFGLLADFLAGLAHAADPGLWELGFRLRLADLLGYRPELGGCMVCGRASDEGEYYFDTARGGIVDASCRGGIALAISKSQIKLWRVLLGARQLTGAVEGSAALSTEGLGLAKAFYDYTFGRNFKSEAMLVAP